MELLVNAELAVRKDLSSDTLIRVNGLTQSMLRNLSEKMAAKFPLGTPR